MLSNDKKTHKTTNAKKLITFVIPVYNEEDNIQNCYQALNEYSKTSQSKYDFEFLFTNNASEDTTLNKIKNLRIHDLRVRYLSFSKNFGYQLSLLEGILNSNGDATILLDCDLQDPLNIVNKFIQYWEQGYHNVYGIRDTRDEPKLISQLRKMAYYIFDKVSRETIPRNVGDFRLIDKAIIKELRKIQIHRPFLRSLIANMGFKTKGIHYHRLDRKFGQSKFPAKKMVSLFIDGCINQSTLPLRLSSYIGIFITLISTILILLYIVFYFFLHPNWPKGYASIVILMFFSIGLNALFFGIIGEYIYRISNIVSNVASRPIIMERSDDKD